MGNAFLGPRDQEEEPMDQGDYDSDVRILEEDEDQPQLLAELPAEQEEQGLFICGKGTSSIGVHKPPSWGSSIQHTRVPSS